MTCFIFLICCVENERLTENKINNVHNKIIICIKTVKKSVKACPEDL